MDRGSRLAPRKPRLLAAYSDDLDYVADERRPGAGSIELALRRIEPRHVEQRTDLAEDVRGKAAGAERAGSPLLRVDS